MENINDCFSLLLIDQQLNTATKTLLNSGKIKGKACYISDLADFLIQKRDKTPILLFFEHRHSERIKVILKIVYMSVISGVKVNFPVNVALLPKDTLEVEITSITEDEVFDYFNEREIIGAATWIACSLVAEYSIKTAEDTDKSKALIELKKQLGQVFDSRLAETDKEAKEKAFKDLESFCSEGEKNYIKNELDTEQEKRGKNDFILTATPYIQEIFSYVTSGDNQRAKKCAERFIMFCNGQGKADENLFEPPQDIDDYLAEMWQRRGLETGLNFKIEDSPEILPFEIVEGITLICGARKHGKTTFLLNMLFNEARKNLNEYKDGKTPKLKQVVFYSYEVTKPRIWQQFFALYAREIMKNNFAGDFNLKREISALYDKKEISNQNLQKEYRELLERLQDKFFVDYIKSGAIVVIADNLSAEDLCESITAFCKNKECSLIGLDYIQELYSGLSDIHKKSRTDELKYIGEQLRGTVNGLKIPLLAAAQFNRQIKTPLDVETNNIGEAGDLERNATAVIGLFNLKELKHPEKVDEINGVISMLYKLGIDAAEMIELVTDITVKDATLKRRIKPCNGKLFCRLICSRFSEAPASVILPMDGKSGFIDIKRSEMALKELNTGKRVELKQQLENLQTVSTPQEEKKVEKKPKTEKQEKGFSEMMKEQAKDQDLL